MMTAEEAALEMAKRAEDQLTEAERLLANGGGESDFAMVIALGDAWTRLSMAYNAIATSHALSRDASRDAVMRDVTCDETSRRDSFKDENSVPSATGPGRHAHSKKVPGGGG